MTTFAIHNAFTTTSSRGLRHDILPMRLYHKAKKLGVWDPQSIDFSQDILDWQRCNDTERETLLQLTSLFQAGEECVTLDLLPLVMVMAQEGRLEGDVPDDFLMGRSQAYRIFPAFPGRGGTGT